MTRPSRRKWQALIPVLLSVAIFAFALTTYPQRRQQFQNRSRQKSTSIKTSGAKWYTFTGPDNDFTIDFPTRPRRAEDVQGPVTILRRYVSTTGTTYFEISLQDFGGIPDSLEANSYNSKFEQNLSQMLNEKGVRIVQIRRTAKNVYEMEAWSPSGISNGYLHNLARGMIRKGRQYVMNCNSLILGQEVDRNVCRRFFNSFHIVGARR